MKNKIFTIPNIISFFRIALIIAFVPVYFASSIEHHKLIAFGIIVLSGLSDVVDGFIARNFNMVSELGKILDPIADKLTQAAVLLCLLINHTELLAMFVVLFIKELLTAIAAGYLLKHKLVKPMSARWWGKLSTAAIYSTIFYVILMEFIEVLPTIVAIVLMAISIVCMILSMLGYMQLVLKVTNNTSKPEIKE
jgi:cardiolipin synthase